MILIELEDVRLIHSWSHFNKDAWTHPDLTPEEDWEASSDPGWFIKHPDKEFYPGPYLIRVNDEEVWMSRGSDDEWRRVVQRFRYESVEQRQWSAYFDLYAAGIGISPATLRNRFMGMRRRLSKIKGKWVPWKAAYPWDEGNDEVWDSLYQHPRWRARVNNEMREVMYVHR